MAVEAAMRVEWEHGYGSSGDLFGVYNPGSKRVEWEHGYGREGKSSQEILETFFSLVSCQTGSIKRSTANVNAAAQGVRIASHAH